VANAGYYVEDGMTETATGADWQSWQASWDRQQEWYMPDREERFRVMLDGGAPMP
jgi:hypothetical protein